MLGRSAANALQVAGDRDWLRSALQAGVTYTVRETVHFGGSALAGPSLRINAAQETCRCQMTTPSTGLSRLGDYLPSDDHGELLRGAGALVDWREKVVPLR